MKWIVTLHCGRQMDIARRVAYNKNAIWKSIMFPSSVTENILLRTDSSGVVRVGNTRVTLDTVISAFRDGATAEEIVQQYPSLNLADVYYVIGYYLRRTSEVDAYLQKRQRDVEASRNQNESRFDPSSVRARLLARRSSK